MYTESAYLRWFSFTLPSSQWGLHTALRRFLFAKMATRVTANWVWRNSVMQRALRAVKLLFQSCFAVGKVLPGVAYLNDG